MRVWCEDQHDSPSLCGVPGAAMGLTAANSMAGIDDSW